MVLVYYKYYFLFFVIFNDFAETPQKKCKLAHFGIVLAHFGSFLAHRRFFLHTIRNKLLFFTFYVVCLVIKNQSIRNMVVNYTTIIVVWS